MTDPILQGRLVGLHVDMTDRTSYANYRDITVARPEGWDGEGWYWYGQRCANEHTGTGDGQYLIIRPHPDYMGEPLAQPLSWRRLWGMTERDGNYNARFALWQADPPPGYGRIGDIFNRNTQPHLSSLEHYVCVADECLIAADIGDKLWTDSGTKASGEGSMWEIADDSPKWKLFVARDNYDSPGGARRLNPDIIEMI